MVPLDDPDLVFGVNEVGVRPLDAGEGCTQRRINRFNFDIIVDREYMFNNVKQVWWVWFGGGVCDKLQHSIIDVCFDDQNIDISIVCCACTCT